MDGQATVRQSYIDLRGLNLGMEFVKGNNLQPGQKYEMTIVGVGDEELEGTLDKSGFIGGLSSLYRRFRLSLGDTVGLAYEGGIIRLTPPADRQNSTIVGVNDISPMSQELVCERLRLRHIHVERYAPGNLGRWTPRTEPDVYMVFGALSEYTDYAYCCGTSAELLRRMGYPIDGRTKPDAILIDRATDQYLVAEFKMDACEFVSNHKPDDVDVLVCWEDTEQNRKNLPPRVLCLKKLLAKAVSEGEIEP